ncbi:gpn3, partial [Symbiodinium sp. KB8]
MKYCQIVMGPAGTGKSTYCQTIQEHCAASGRSVHVINLDPAAEAFKYQIDADVRDLISVDEVMDELGMGPNGGLLYCMEYLAESIEWFQEILRNFGEDDYVLLDCPGQIELYSHIPVMRRVVDVLRSEGEQCGPASARGRAGGGLLCRVESRAGRDVVDGGQARGADAQRHFPLETAPGKGGGGSLCFAAPPRLLQCTHWPPSATRDFAAFAARLIRAAPGFNVAGVYTIDAMFVTDAAKLLSGNLAALSAMVHLELPHVN